MRRIKQIRYFSDDSGKNYPASVRSHTLSSGTAFTDFTPIVQLGIQALPGTKFYLNGADTDPIIIGSTGIYEIDLVGETQISALRFDRESVANIANTDNAVLIVDMIYEGADK